MILRTAFAAILLSLLPLHAHGKLKVVTTTTDLRELVEEVGGAEVDVEALCKGGQDPHFIEAKPSFMVKVNRADLVLAVGLGLESGWIPNILRGARNPKVNPGTNGYFEIGPQLPVIDKATGALSRSQGDVHPEGNPHVTLDPVRAGHAAMLIAERLGKLNEANSKTFTERAKAFQNRMNEKVKAWETKLEPVKMRKVITYHKTLTYFLDRFKFESVATLEPKPGIPPTASHILRVMKTMKESGIKLILVENYFDSKVAGRIKEEMPSVSVVSVPVAVEGVSGVDTLDKLYDHLVNVVAEKGK